MRLFKNISLVFLLLCVSFSFFGCSGSSDTSAQFYGFERVGNSDVYTAKVTNTTETINLNEIVTVANTSRWKVAFDAVATNEIASKTVTLSAGNNSFYIIVTAQNGKKRTYTLQIQREAVHTISFMTYGGRNDARTIGTKVVKDGNTIGEAITEHPIWLGYDFIGWDFDASAIVTENKQVAAVWAKKDDVQVIPVWVSPKNEDTAYEGGVATEAFIEQIEETVAQLKKDLIGLGYEKARVDRGKGEYEILMELPLSANPKAIAKTLWNPNEIELRHADGTVVLTTEHFSFCYPEYNKTLGFSIEGARRFRTAISNTTEGGTLDVWINGNLLAQITVTGDDMCPDKSITLSDWSTEDLDILDAHIREYTGDYEVLLKLAHSTSSIEIADENRFLNFWHVGDTFSFDSNIFNIMINGEKLTQEHIKQSLNVVILRPDNRSIQLADPGYVYDPNDMDDYYTRSEDKSTWTFPLSMCPEYEDEREYRITFSIANSDGYTATATRMVFVR